MYVLYPFGPVSWANITEADTNCSDGISWIYVVMGDCVRDTRSYASVIVGLVSVLIWMFVGFPQMYKNCRSGQAVEALSILFIIQWLLGDSTNLIGCILTHQLPVQMYTAIYYVFADLVLLSQFLYYRAKKRHNSRKTLDTLEVAHNTIFNTPAVVLCISGGLFFYCTGQRLIGQLTSIDDRVKHFPASRSLLSSLDQRVPIFQGPIDETGYAVGILSTLFYIGSRLAQIITNVRRQSTEGVSMLMFSLAILGNFTYGLAIFLRVYDITFLIRHLPWIIGSHGIMFFDIFILSQSFYYRRHHYTEELGGRQLLVNDDIIS